MSLGTILINIRDGGLAISGSSNANTAVVLGWCSKVSTWSPYPALQSFTQPSDVATALGYGPGPEAAATILNTSGGTVYVMPVQQSAAGVVGSWTPTHTGTGTISVSSGTPYDRYKLLVKVVNTPATFLVSTGNVAVQVSLDNGVNWGNYTLVPSTGVLALSKAGGAVLGDTGLTLTLDNGTFKVGDQFACPMKEPYFTGTQIAAAFTALLGDPRTWSLVNLATIADSGSDQAALYTSLVTGMAATTAAYRYARSFMSAFPDTDSNIISAWSSSPDNTRINVAATTDNVFSPLIASVIERPHSNALVARLCGISPSRSPGYADDGPLTSVVSTNRDERATPGLIDQRFSTAVTVINRNGVYTDGEGRMHVAGTSDFSNVMNCRVMDLCCNALVQAALHFQNDTVTLVNGLISALDASRIQQYVRAKIIAVAGSELSDVTVSVYASDNILSTQTLRANISIVPKGYFKNVEFDVGFENPNITAQAA